MEALIFMMSPIVFAFAMIWIDTSIRYVKGG